MAMGKQVGRLSIRVLPDATRFRDDLKLMVKRVEQSVAVNLKVLADTKEAELKIREFRKAESTKTIDMRVSANTLIAKGQLAALTRSRTATINAKISAKSVAAVETFFKAISGQRLAAKVLREVREGIENLDRAVPRIGQLSLMFGNLTSSILAASAGIVTVSGDILRMGNAGLVLPAIFAALAVGTGVLIAALKDTKTQLAVLGPAFHQMQDSISAAFWAQAQQPILSFVRSILPQLRAGFTATADSLGKQAAGLADGFKKSFGGGVLETMFGRLTQSIDIVTTGTGAFASAVTILGLKGSEYLPRFSQWVTDIGTSFDTWLKGAAATGELNRIIEGGIDSLKKFGSSVGSIVRIFQGIDRAATAAGATGLTSFSEKLKAAADSINGSTFQSTITTLLGGASRGLGMLGDGIKSVGSAISTLSPTISQALGDAGSAIGSLLGSIGDAMKRPAFQKGLGDLFGGLESGVKSLGAAMPAVADLLGQLGSTVGTLAQNFGPLLAVIKETFAPVLDGLLASLTPLITSIGTLLVGAIATLTPAMQAFGSFLTGNPELVQGFALAIGGLVLALKAVQFGSFIAGWVASTAAMLASKAETLAIVALYAKDFVVAMAKATAGIVVSTGKWIANTAALIANKVQGLAIVGIYAKDLIVGLAKSAATLAIQTGAWIANTAAQIASKVALIAGAVASGIATAAQWALNVAMTANPIGIIVAAIAALVAGLIWFFTQTKLGQEIWANFTKFLGEAWNNIVSFVQDAIANIIGWVSQNWGLLLSLLIGPLGLVIQWIVENWSGILQFFSDVWNGIVAYVTTAINVVLAVVAAIGNTISAVWNGLWTGISSFVSGAWNGIVAFVTAGINLALSIVRGVGNTISSVWSGMWSGLGSAVSGAWSLIQGIVRNIVNGVSGMIGDIGRFLGQIPKVIGDAFAGAGSWLVNSGKAIIQGLIDGIGKMIDVAKNAAKGVMDAIANFFPHSPAKEGPFSGRGWTPYSGMALVDGFADGIDSRIDRVRQSALAMMGAASGTARVDLAGADAAGQALLSRAAGDSIVVQGNVGYDPQAIADELALKKRQAALRNGVGTVVVK